MLCPLDGGHQLSLGFQIQVACCHKARGPLEQGGAGEMPSIGLGCDAGVNGSGVVEEVDGLSIDHKVQSWSIFIVGCTYFLGWAFKKAVAEVFDRVHCCCLFGKRFCSLEADFLLKLEYQ